MLAIRMQRIGRKGHPTYRIVVQDSRQTPKSGKYVALLGSYDPHVKTNTLAKEKAQFYLDHGAQPSDRVVRLLKSEGVTLPKWIKEPTVGQRTTRNPEKLRKNQPEQPAEEPVIEDKVTNTEETPQETDAGAIETPETVEEVKTEEVVAETEVPTEEPTDEKSEDKKT